MKMPRDSRSEGGVFVADDFRDNLIIDRYDPCFARMRASKTKHLRSENSEDAVTWNVFRSLRQIDPAGWVNHMSELAFNKPMPGDVCGTTVELWVDVSPPISLVKEADEGVSEIDIVIENPYWVWFIEAKLNSDISTGTTTRPDRNQILRNLDVGTFYAGVRHFYFCLLVRDRERSAKGARMLELYKKSTCVQEALPHRKDKLTNLRHVSLLTWEDMASVLRFAGSNAWRPDEHLYAQRCLQWLADRGICQRQQKLRSCGG